MNEYNRRKQGYCAIWSGPPLIFRVVWFSESNKISSQSVILNCVFEMVKQDILSYFSYHPNYFCFKEMSWNKYSWPCPGRDPSSGRDLRYYRIGIKITILLSKSIVSVLYHYRNSVLEKYHYRYRYRNFRHQSINISITFLQSKSQIQYQC